MKSLFPKSRAGEFFVKNHNYKFSETKKFELFYVDDVPENMASYIRSVWKNTVGRAKNDMKPTELTKIASECSRELYRNLPWYGLSSVDQFDFIMQAGAQRKKQLQFYENYLFEKYDKTPHNLSNLIETNALNCNSHSVIIKESIKKRSIGIFSLFDSEQELNHHTNLVSVGKYFLRIDTSVLPRKEIYRGEDPEKLYVISKKDSVVKNKYLPTTFLHK